MEHTPDPQPTVYEGILFVWEFGDAWGLLQGSVGIFFLNIGKRHSSKRVPPEKPQGLMFHVTPGDPFRHCWEGFFSAGDVRTNPKTNLGYTGECQSKHTHNLGGGYDLQL